MVHIILAKPTKPKRRERNHFKENYRIQQWENKNTTNAQEREINAESRYSKITEINCYVNKWPHATIGFKKLHFYEADDPLLINRRKMCFSTKNFCIFRWFPCNWRPKNHRGSGKNCHGLNMCNQLCALTIQINLLIKSVINNT